MAPHIAGDIGPQIPVAGDIGAANACAFDLDDDIILILQNGIGSILIAEVLNVIETQCLHIIHTPFSNLQCFP